MVFHVIVVGSLSEHSPGLFCAGHRPGAGGEGDGDPAQGTTRKTELTYKNKFYHIENNNKVKDN